jgi:hypothetical protein
MVIGRASVPNFVPMPEVTVRYSSRESLDALIGIAGYLGLSVELPAREGAARREKGSGRTERVGEASVVIPDEATDWDGLRSIFTDKGLDAAELRRKAWDRDRG